MARPTCVPPPRRTDREIAHRDGDGEYHCEDGPARIMPNGSKWYMVHGLFHRLDGPALEFSEGGGRYFINHREMTKEVYQQHPEVLAYAAAQRAQAAAAAHAKTRDSLAIKKAQTVKPLNIVLRKP